MIVLAHIEGVYPGIEAHKDVARALLNIYPDCADKDGNIRVVLPQDDERVQLMCACLESFGFKPNDTGNGFRNFSMYFERVYDEQDYTQSQYLVMGVTSALSVRAERLSDGLLEFKYGEEFAYNLDDDPESVEEWRLRLAQTRMGTVGHGWVLVSDELRRKIQSSGFVGPCFLAVHAKNLEGRPLERVFWELRSDVILPPVCSPSRLVSQDGEPFTGDYSHGCLLWEDSSHPNVRYSPPHLHYIEQELSLLSPFDVGRTREEFGVWGQVVHELIVSQRFFRFCVAEGLHLWRRPAISSR